MADKFPALDDVVQTTNGDEADFLQREQALVGDEFTQLDDAEAVEEDEVSKFESQFPLVGETEALSLGSESQDEAPAESKNKTAAEGEVLTEDEAPVEGGEPASVTKAASESEESEAIRSWREASALEIAKRDEEAVKKKEAIKAEAAKAVEDFYENYHNKKEAGIEETKKAEAAFLEARDGFLSQDTTVWDRVLTLIDTSESTVTGNRDKTKFKELLLKLKGNDKAPGAAGY